MNIKYTFFSIAFLLIFGSNATPLLGQGGWVNDGANIQISSGTDVRIESGGMTSQNNGSITNEGNIYLDLDWTQTGASTTYTGAGWMWFEGAVNQNISSLSVITIPKLRVDNGNRLILNSSINVSTEVDLMNNGNIELGTNNLIVNSGAVISNYDANNYVITNSTGHLQQEVSATNVFFPVGNSTYNPATLNNAGTTDNFQARVEEVVYDYGTVGTPETAGVVNRTWHIDEATTGGSDVTMTLQWETSEELAFDRTNCGIAHWDGSQWDHPTAYSNATNVSGSYYNQTRSGLTSFSPFALEDLNELLPIELLNFTAKRENANQVLLNWATSSETNNEAFDVERMLDNETEWTTVGWKAGAGNSTTTTNYEFSDDNAYPNISYYRLRQRDFDGTETLSEVRAVEGIPQAGNLTLYPNPTQDIIHVRFADFSAKEATIRVYSADGKLVFEKQYALTTGTVIQLTETQELPTGTYLMQAILDNGDMHNRKFVKLSH